MILKLVHGMVAVVILTLVHAMVAVAILKLVHAMVAGILAVILYYPTDTERIGRKT